MFEQRTHTNAESYFPHRTTFIIFVYSHICTALAHINTHQFITTPRHHSTHTHTETQTHTHNNIHTQTHSLTRVSEQCEYIFLFLSMLGAARFRRKIGHSVLMRFGTCRNAKCHDCQLLATRLALDNRRHGCSKAFGISDRFAIPCVRIHYDQQQQ